MQTYIIIALVSYLLGSIPFGYILVRLFLKQDIRTTGSGNIGATNVGRTGHKGLAIATLLLDAGKGFLATTLALMGSAYALSHAGSEARADAFSFCAFAALCAVVGHMFPVWLKFQGGKGVATAVGAFSLLAPRAVLVALIVFLLTVAVTRYVSLGSILAAIAFPIASFFMQSWLGPDLRPAPAFYIFAWTTSLLIILKHHANIRRLIAGTEPKLGAKPPNLTTTPPPPDQMEKHA